MSSRPVDAGAAGESPQWAHRTLTSAAPNPRSDHRAVLASLGQHRVDRGTWDQYLGWAGCFGQQLPRVEEENHPVVRDCEVLIIHRVQAVIVGTVALSLGSAFGLSVLIWQHILHMPLHWLVLPMAIIVMLAVGSDYNLLLIARFQEEIGAGLKTGMIRAMAGTGRVVTIAGLVFAFTMGSMVASDLRVVGQIGTTIMIGLLFDTLVVRSYMTPALATLLGRWFWWPRRVDRLARQPQVLGPRRTTALSAERAALLQ